MKKVNLVVRILLGVMMLVFGVNKFANFMPMPPLPDEAMTVMGAFMKSGYIMPIVGIVEIVAGILFLANKYTALAAVILFPVMLNALLFHIFLAPGGLAPAGLAVVMNIMMFFANKDKFDDILSA